MATVVVTGGAGFIGANVVRGLLAEGYEVAVLDNFSTWREEHLADVVADLRIIRGDVREPEAVADALTGADAVLHYAAARAVNKSVAEPEETHDVNTSGTFNVLQAARLAGVQRVVLASTSAVYGNPADTTLFTEELLPHPVSPYAAAKLAGEAYCQAFSASYGLETVILRLFNVYGPWQHPEGDYSLVVPIFLDRLLSNQAPEIHGTGEQRRDFVFTADVVAANILALQHEKPLLGEIYNIGSGQATSVQDVFDTIQQQLGTSITPQRGSARAGDVPHTCADISKAQRELGYTPAHDFAAGIAASIEDYQRRRVS